MNIEMLPLAGSAVVEPRVFEDHRGAFARFFCKNELRDVIGDREIVNVNFSHSVQKGTVRGMHFQHAPNAEMKLVRCIRGAIYDVIIDIRKDSPTFLQWYGVELTEQNRNMIVIPEGFAHGFQALTDNCEILYLTTEFYSPDSENGIRFDDPCVNISWPLPVTDISDKDQNHSLLTREFKGITVL